MIEKLDYTLDNSGILRKKINEIIDELSRETKANVETQINLIQRVKQLEKDLKELSKFARNRE